MENIILTCIGCPLGCPVTVTREDGEIVEITGNTCKRGEVYARKEVTNPTRIVTGTMCVTGGCAPLVSVKTREDIPKAKIFDCIREIHQTKVPAPIAIGDVLIENVAGTGVAVVATRRVGDCKCT